MKRYNTPDVTDETFIREAIHFAAKNKGQRREVKRVLKNEDYYIQKLKDMICNRSFVPSPVKQMTILDGTSKKQRVIYCPRFFPDQCFHHVMMKAAVPVIMKGMSPHTFASVPERGAHYGKKFVRKWLDTDHKHTKYCAKLDIRKFYPSIPHDRLLEKIHNKFKDDTLLWMFDVFINSHEDSPGRGLAIGFYPSQWLSNFYLQDFDHYVKEELHIRYYCRYMDDIVFFGNNKKLLHKQMEQVIMYLNNHGLTVKDNWQVFRFDYVRRKDGKRCGRDLDFMGFRFYRDKTTIRRRNSLKIRRSVAKAKKVGRISFHRAASIISYMGWIKYTDSFKYNARYVGGIINIQALTKIISNHQRRINLRQAVLV